MLAWSMDAPKVTQDGRDGDQEPGYIANIKDGTVIGFKYFDFQDVKRITLQIRAYASGGTIEVRTSPNGPTLARLTLHNTDVWTPYTASFTPPAGKQALYLLYSGRGNAQLKSVAFE